MVTHRCDSVGFSRILVDPSIRNPFPRREQNVLYISSYRSGVSTNYGRATPTGVNEWNGDVTTAARLSDCVPQVGGLTFAVWGGLR